MAIIKPFKGIRPARELAAQVAALPYDVLSSEEARQIGGPNPWSFLHVTRSEIDLDPRVDPYSDEVYRKSSENFERFLRERTLLRDTKDCLYIYQLEMEGRVQTGVMAGVSAEEYEKDIIKKHELTRLDKVEDRMKHTLALNVNPGPVFLTYRAREEINQLVDQIISTNPPAHDFRGDDGIRHTLWVIADPEQIDWLVNAFRKIPCLYIADGHHRASVGAMVAALKKKENPKHTGHEQCNFFLAVCFPHRQLKIMDYNRVVRDLNGLSEAEFMKKVWEGFSVEPSDNKKPDRKGTFKMYLGSRWYKLEARENLVDEKDPVKSLDVSVLQDNLLDPILGIHDPRRDKRIDFVGGIRGTAELERRCQKDCVVAFSLYPMSIEELIGIADAGKLVPPKSTWFEPKLRCGLVVKPLYD